MSITTLVFLVVYLAGLALAFSRPITGLCAYLWAFYNNPPSAWWGSELPTIRWSLIAAVVTLVAYGWHSVSRGAPVPEQERAQ
jgi:hypothetical protein